MISGLVFIALLILSFSNGIFLTSFWEKKFTLQLISIYIITGIVSTTFLVYFVRLLNFPFWAITLISLVILIWQFRKKINFPKFNLSPFLASIFFVLFVTVILGSIGFYQGYKDGSLVFFDENSHDGLWHIALQKSLIISIPPQNPIFTGEILRGYHYFTDLYWAYLAAISHLSSEVVYLSLMPFLLSALFGLTTLSLFCYLTKDKVVAYLGSAILIFGSGFAFFVPFLFPGGSNNQSTFWLDQPVGYIINPHLLLSFSIINVLFLMFFNSIKKWRILFGIILASLVVIKVYAFLILAPIFGLMAIYFLIKSKNLDLLISCLIALVLSVILVFTSGVGNGFPFLVEPGWFVKSMFETSDHLNTPQWELQRQVYLAHGNYPHLIFHWIWGYSIFILGNYGLKILGLLLVPLIILKSNQEIRIKAILLLGIIVLSLSPSLIFLQKGVVWSSIQFMHFAQLPLCLLILWGTNLLRKKWQYLILVLILLFGLPTTANSFINTINSTRYEFYSSEAVSGIKQLDLTAKKSTVITNLFKDTSLVPALSGRSVYYTDPNMLGILQVDFEQRKNWQIMVENLSLCPTNNILLTLPESTVSGKIVFQNKTLKIVECS